jgi:diacylglycerol kinase
MKIINKAINLVGKMLKGLVKWFKDAGMELIAQAFTLLCFFIAWLTLTGSARDIVGIAVLITTVIWLITIPLRKEE